jgi:hypothetical protein
MATLYLIKTCYEIKDVRGSYDWIICLALLIPEILWFDVMTSRETLMAALVIFALLTTGRYYAKTSTLTQRRAIIIVGLSTLAIAATRTSVVLPIVASIILMSIIIRPRHCRFSMHNILLLSSAVILLIAAPFVSKAAGGYEFGFNRAIMRSTSFQNNVASVTSWSDNSIGLLLTPGSPWQAVLLMPPRMILYLVAPLPNISVSVHALMAGSWGHWQHLMTLLTSIINVLLMPCALASLLHSVKTRKDDAKPMILHVAFWVTFAAIAGGNLIIHERYRIMASILFISCAWLGITKCTKRQIIEMSIFWYGGLALLTGFYVFYKII